MVGVGGVGGVGVGGVCWGCLLTERILAVSVSYVWITWLPLGL